MFDRKITLKLLAVSGIGVLAVTLLAGGDDDQKQQPQTAAPPPATIVTYQGRLSYDGEAVQGLVRDVSGKVKNELYHLTAGEDGTPFF